MEPKKRCYLRVLAPYVASNRLGSRYDGNRETADSNQGQEARGRLVPKVDLHCRGVGYD